MHKLVLLRHGLSEWNLQNRFTGWHDVDLADAGIGESRKAGKHCVTLGSNSIPPIRRCLSGLYARSGWFLTNSTKCGFRLSAIGG